MSSEDDKAAVSKELMEKVANPDLEHTETTASKAPMILKLRCQETGCNVVNDFPVHCDTQMDYIEPDQLVCGTCNVKMTVASHHNKPMRPFIAKA